MQVVGVDYCGRFISTAMQIQNDGVVKFNGGKEARIPDGVEAKNVNFVQVGCPNHCDVLTMLLILQLTWLPNEVENHDFVLVEFLDRVVSPKSKNTIEWRH